MMDDPRMKNHRPPASCCYQVALKKNIYVKIFHRPNRDIAGKLEGRAAEFPSKRHKLKTYAKLM
jgi:hypothetical protein